MVNKVVDLWLFFPLYQSLVGWLMRLMGFICEEFGGLYLPSLCGKAFWFCIHCWNLQNLQYSYVSGPLMTVKQPALTSLNMECLRRTLQSYQLWKAKSFLCSSLWKKVCWLKVINSYKLTFAVSVGTSENGAFLDAAEGLEKAPHIIFWLLLVEHAHKELSVF